jgi:hypothetical protein
MKPTQYALGVLGALAAVTFTATAASAQIVNLTGAYRCVEGCRAAPGGTPAFVTHNGPNLNLVNEAGQPSRAWPDTFAPNSRIWADNWNVGAVYSPDGMIIQFDNGTIWQRDVGPPVRVQYQPAAVVR